MKSILLPTTTLGKWSVWSGIAFLILMVIVFMSVIFTVKDQIPQSFFDPLWAAIALIIAGACGTAALVTGLVSIIRNKERAILVFLAVVAGVFALFFLLGELLFPH